VNPSTVRSIGSIVAILALLSACSSQRSERSQQEPDTRKGRRPASAAVQPKASEEARLAQKAQVKNNGLLFVKDAQKACRGLTRKIETLTTDSTVDFSQLNSFIPIELYPTDPFAAYVNERTLSDVKSLLTQLVGSVVELLRSLERSQATSTARNGSHTDDANKFLATFQDKKLKALANTDAYCESIRRAGAGVDMLP
jgi:hypothetical protein